MVIHLSACLAYRLVTSGWTVTHPVSHVVTRGPPVSRRQDGDRMPFIA
jgi:hypothetical protein